MQTQTKNIVWNKDALSVEGLTISLGGKQLINNSELTITYGDRIGLLGRNGCGKTTLFNFISTQSKQKNKIVPWSIYEVVQELPSTEQSITAVVLSSHLERGILWNRRNELELIDDMSDIELAEYNSVCERLEGMNAEADIPKAKIILRGLGFAKDELESPLNSFSGGWRARVALACGLFMEPDLLMLDEPTNHLDLNAVIWLANFCKSWKKTLVVITHNSYFAHNVCNSIIHINNKKIGTYKCTYNKFLKMRTQIEEKELKDWEKLEKEIAKLKATGNIKNKKAAEELLEKKAKEGVTRPPKSYKPKFMFENSNEYKEGTALLNLTEASFSYGDKLILKNVNYALYPLSRSVLVGENGAGKSTLLKLLIGSIEPNQGTCMRKAGLTVKYFNQHFYHDLPPTLNPIEYVSSQSKKSQIDIVRKLLGASGLEGEAHTRQIDTLSGGQKARVYFAGLVISQPDILLLDEPTNHLDMETTEGLLNGLKDFPGAVVIVSHDLDFLEELGTEVWIVERQQVLRLGEGIDGLGVYVDKVMKTTSQYQI
jgi:ATPase subunit of ABC transporter with duplicated ATPase domains